MTPAPPKQPEIVFEEPTVDEGEIMKAYNALMAEDGRWDGSKEKPWGKTRSEWSFLCKPIYCIQIMCFPACM